MTLGKKYKIDCQVMIIDNGIGNNEWSNIKIYNNLFFSFSVGNEWSLSGGCGWGSYNFIRNFPTSGSPATTV